VVVMVEEPKEDHELKAFSEHSANAIPEWQDPAEDEIWT